MPQMEPKEEEVFQIIYEKYIKLMYHVIYGILGNKEDAEDALQEAFIRIAKNISKISAPICPQTQNFVVIISRNVALSILKKNKKTVSVLLLEELADEREGTDPENVVNAEVLLQTVTEAVGELSDIYRDCIYMHIVEEYDAKEIAELLSVPVSAVRKRIQRGMKMLKKKLEERGVTYGE